MSLTNDRLKDRDSVTLSELALSQDTKESDRDKIVGAFSNMLIGSQMGVFEMFQQQSTKEEMLQRKKPNQIVIFKPSQE